VTVACFEGELANSAETTWSLVIESTGESTESLDKAQAITAEVTFLLPDKAPLHLLAPGKRFKLLEGKRVVATGEIMTGASVSGLHGTMKVQQK